MNKTILITGGTGKVGSQLVKHFYQQGFNVVFTGKQKSEISNLTKALCDQKIKNRLLGIAINLTQPKAPQKMLAITKKEGLLPTHLVNCARDLTFLKVQANGLTGRVEWLGELTLDVLVPYELSMVFASLPGSPLTSIINISSMYGIVPANPHLYKNPQNESPIQYSVAKAAQIHLTKELAIRLAEKDIKVNCISFGGIEGRVDEAFKKRYAQLCPLKKMLKEHEVINAVDFLVNSSAISMTGHNLVVDGGWSVW